MSQNELRNLLSQLHARLGNAHSLDADDRRLLTSALADIENALAHDAVAPVGDGAEESLESLAVRFEAGHPALAQSLRSLVDTLGKAGI